MTELEKQVIKDITSDLEDGKTPDMASTEILLRVIMFQEAQLQGAFKHIKWLTDNIKKKGK